MLAFDGRGGNGVPGKKTTPSRVEDQQTQSTYDAECGNRTRATLVEGKCSHTRPTLPPPYMPLGTVRLPAPNCIRNERLIDIEMYCGL